LADLQIKWKENDVILVIHRIVADPEFLRVFLIKLWVPSRIHGQDPKRGAVGAWESDGRGPL